MSQSFLQMNTVFISILIESLPFILLAVILSGIIQIFVTEEMLAKIIPKNRYLSVLVTTLLGALFPACECGIIPITKRLIAKGVPLHAGVGFMQTAPVINPIVVMSTYAAFGNSWRMVLYRCGLSFFVSFISSIILSFQFKDSQLKQAFIPEVTHKIGFTSKLDGMIRHTIDEFFSVGKYLIMGALIASAMQTYIKTSTLVSIGHGTYSAILLMMALAFILSICSSADAFIASSFRSTFGTGSIVAFLVFGAIFDIKNLLMMTGTFKKKFVFFLFIYTIVLTSIGALFL
ncbi:permease [Peribacillus asahii]|uniref:Membrane protein n=1 Tax=Peribacillus asahii TaxID=228899 RepID=A0A3Q9RMP2_9BACI|nr:permease [Peribacillus asahii]AZV42691.1 membrane protein [Peribacillus asahii]USK86952.1 permease [Peribacillus asahii]